MSPRLSNLISDRKVEIKMKRSGDRVGDECNVAEIMSETRTSELRFKAKQTLAQTKKNPFYTDDF